MTFAVWGPGLIVLVFGAIAAIIAVMTLGRLQPRTSDRDAKVRDLDERIEHAVAQLRDFQLQEARIEPSFFGTQRAELESRAAGAMRERDAVLASVDTILTGPDRPKRDAARTDVSPAIGWFEARPWAKASLWIVGILAVGGVLAASLSIEQHPRENGGSMTGGEQARGPMQASPADDAELKALLARLQANPKDVDAMLGLTKRLLRAQMFEEAEQLLVRIKEIDPDNATARVYGAVMLAARGSGEQANHDLDAVTKEHPELPDGWFFRGMLAMQAGDNDRMRDSFEHFVAVAPPGPQRDRVRGMLEGRGP